jgi:peptidyl-prolyl cis-trans isomerase C
MKKIITPLLISLLIFPATLVAANEDVKEAEQNPVLVTVNGVGISEQELRHFMAQQPTVKTPQEAIREMINVELLNQAARNADIMQTETLQLEIKRSTAALIASTYLQNYLDNLDISDEQLKQRYQNDYVDNSETKEFNANHILVKTEQEARNIITRLDNGESFEELAMKLSTGPSGKKGGALGWFKKEDMVAPFSAATAELEKGKYSSAPVQTRFGWHVIQLNDIRDSEPPSLDSVRKNLATSIAAEAIQNKLKELQETATIEFK